MNAGARHGGGAAAGAVATVLAGALFGFGLALSGMVRPEVVLAFLQFEDAGLLLVMGGALALTLPAYQWLPRLRAQPLLGGAFDPHTARAERNTLVGAALFGIGWGLSGVCPGPAIAGLGTGNVELLWTVAGLAAGAWLHGATAQVGAGDAPQEG